MLPFFSLRLDQRLTERAPVLNHDRGRNSEASSRFVEQTHHFLSLFTLLFLSMSDLPLCRNLCQHTALQEGVCKRASGFFPF